MRVSAIIRIVIWLIVAAVLVALLVGGLYGGVFNNMDIHFSGFNFGGYSYSDSEKYTVGGAEVAAAGLKNLDVDWISGSITVKVWDGDTVSVSETADFQLSQDERLRWYKDGDTLKIKFRAPRTGFPVSNVSGKSLTVLVPAELSDGLSAITLNATSADIGIEDLSLSRLTVDTVSGETRLYRIRVGTLDVDGVSGNIAMTGVTCGGATFNTVSGEIDAESFTADIVEADTTSGGVSIQGSVKAFDVDTTSGDIYLSSDVCPESIKVDSTSGGAAIRLPRNSSFTASLDTVSGDLEYDFAAKGGKDYIIVGDGTANFEFDSVSGDVKIMQGA